MQKKKIYRRIPEIRLLHRQITGAIGKQFVIKHYSYGAIRTKYPDMSKVKATIKQRKCRTTFQDAVAYAKTVISDPVLKAQWQNKLRRHNGVYNAAIKEYMLREKNKKLLDKQQTNWLLWKAINNPQQTGATITYHNQFSQRVPRIFKQKRNAVF